MNDLIKRLENLKSEILNLKSHLNLPQKEQRVLELEERMQEKNFWADNENAQMVSREYNQLKKFYGFWRNLEKEVTETLGLAKDQSVRHPSLTLPLKGREKDHKVLQKVPPPEGGRLGGGEDLDYLKKQTEDLETQYRKITTQFFLSIAEPAGWTRKTGQV